MKSNGAKEGRRGRGSFPLAVNKKLVKIQKKPKKCAKPKASNPCVASQANLNRQIHYHADRSQIQRSKITVHLSSLQSINTPFHSNSIHHHKPISKFQSQNQFEFQWRVPSKPLENPPAARLPGSSWLRRR